MRVAALFGLLLAACATPVDTQEPDRSGFWSLYPSPQYVCEVDVCATYSDVTLTLEPAGCSLAGLIEGQVFESVSCEARYSQWTVRLEITMGLMGEKIPFIAQVIAQDRKWDTVKLGVLVLKRPTS